MKFIMTWRIWVWIGVRMRMRMRVIMAMSMSRSILFFWMVLNGYPRFMLMGMFMFVYSIGYKSWRPISVLGWYNRLISLVNSSPLRLLAHWQPNLLGCIHDPLVSPSEQSQFFRSCLWSSKNFWSVLERHPTCIETTTSKNWIILYGGIIVVTSIWESLISLVDISCSL